MDQKLFEQLLTETAEWFRPETLLESLRSKRRILQLEREQQEESLYDYDDQSTEDQQTCTGINTTLPARIKKLKIQTTICADCDRRCDQGRRVEKQLYKTVKEHWRERCATCKMTRNPNTGKFDLTDRYAAGVWANWLRSKKSLNQTPRDK